MRSENKYKYALLLVKQKRSETKNTFTDEVCYNAEYVLQNLEGQRLIPGYRINTHGALSKRSKPFQYCWNVRDLQREIPYIHQYRTNARLITDLHILVRVFLAIRHGIVSFVGGFDQQPTVEGTAFGLLVSAAARSAFVPVADGGG